METRMDSARPGTAILTVAAVALAVFFLAWGGIQLTRENDRIAAVWLANGLVVGVLMREPRERWASIFAGAIAGNLSANLVSGDAWPSALGLTMFNQVEILIAAAMTAPAFRRHRRIDDGSVIRRFLIATITACTVSALIAASYLHLSYGVPLIAVGMNWFLSDALGLLTVTPVVIAAFDRQPLVDGDRKIAALLTLLAIIVSVGVMFGQSGQPLLFTLAPIIFYAALRLPLLAALFMVCIVSTVALVATLDGHGIIAAANPDPTQRMYILQLFVAVQLFTVLPVRALIAERDRFGRAAAESDRLFRRIAEASPAGIIHFDAAGRPTFANGRWTRLTGAAFDDLGNDGWLRAIDRPFLAAARSLWANARATDRPVVAEFPYCREGVRAGWAELNIFPEIDGHRLLGFVARLTDVTARREAEEALSTREALYRLVTENAHDVVFRLSAGGTVDYVSSAIERQFGMTPGELVGRPFASIIVDDDVAALATILAAEQDLAEPVVQFRLKRANGDPAWVEASYNLLNVDDSGQAPEIVVSLRDIDRRRQSELKMAEASARLLERNRLLQMAEELAEVGHWRVDLKTGALETSQKTLELAGLSEGAVISPVSILANVLPEDRPRLLRMLAQVRRSATTVGGPIRVRNGDAVRHLRVAVQADFDASGFASGIFGVVRDKTEFIIAQQSLIEARDEARAAAQAKSHFLATMSHEIRTPMTGVLGMIDLLRDEADQAQRDRYFATLKQSADLMMAVVDDVLDFSKIDSGAIKLDSTDFDLKELLASTVELFGNAASRKGLLLTLDVRGAADGAVSADPVRIQQVVSNLLSNAIKFTSHGRVRVSLADRPLDDRSRTWSIRVSDTGIGIEQEEVGKLFQPFVQADGTSVRKFGGTGLGLAISRRLVEAMRGDIGVETRLGEGSTFWVQLPLDNGSVAQAAAQVRRRDATLGPEGNPGLDLLVAEDNPVNQMLIGAILRKLGHRVTMVDNGRAAVDAAAARPFDGILMDMQMPEMDGLAATRAIRARGGSADDIPIIALTADASPERRRFYNGVGLSHFLTKPIDQAELAATLAKIAIGRHGRAARSADSAS